MLVQGLWRRHGSFGLGVWCECLMAGGVGAGGLLFGMMLGFGVLGLLGWGQPQ